MKTFLTKACSAQQLLDAGLLGDFTGEGRAKSKVAREEADRLVNLVDVRSSHDE